MPGNVCSRQFGTQNCAPLETPDGRGTYCRYCGKTLSGESLSKRYDNAPIDGQTTSEPMHSPPPGEPLKK